MAHSSSSHSFDPSSLHTLSLSVASLISRLHLREEPSSITTQRTIKHYSNLHHILLVGEGDFSFSNALARAFGSATNIVATSLDCKETVVSQYGSSLITLDNLRNLGALVIHGVDATTMANHKKIRNMSFDRIVFNFPHAGFTGREHQHSVIKKHKRLVRCFFQNAVKLLKPDGEVHVTHKVMPPFSNWKLEEQAAKSGLRLRDSCDFSRYDHPGYINMRGEGVNCGKTFPVGGAATFKFVLDQNHSTF